MRFGNNLMQKLVYDHLISNQCDIMKFDWNLINAS